ncbi:hypothetical protein [Rhodococcus triatomae]
MHLFASDVMHVAEAGISECANIDGGDCMPGFGAFLAAIAGGAVAVIVWLSLAAAVTIPITTARTLPRSSRIVWLLAVWLVPIVGAAAWLVRSRQAARS